MLKQLVRLWLVCLVLLCAGCAGSSLRAPASQWYRAETEHFALYTDLDARRAAEHARKLEDLLAAYLQFGWVVKGPLPLKLNVVMFASPRDFGDYADRRIGGFLSVEKLFEPWMVLPAPRHDGELFVIRHELAHFVAHQGMQSQPRWFAEGIACYFETAHVDDEGRFVIGEVPLWRLRPIVHGMLPTAQLFANETAAIGTGDFYETAWLLVHYLMSERGSAFERYQTLLAQGRGHSAAWQQAFPDLARDSLDDTLRAYLRKGEFASWQRPVQLRPQTAVLHTLSQADRLAIDGVLRLCRDCPPAERARAQESVARARSLDPTQVQATVIAALELGPEGPAEVEVLQALTRAHPEHWLSWVAYGMALERLSRLGQSTGEQDPVARALALAPRQPYAQMLDAFQQAQRGAHAVAAQRAKRALRIAPTDVRLLRMGARLFASVSDCSALASVRRVLEEIEHAPRLTEARNELDRLSRACVAQPWP